MDALTLLQEMEAACPVGCKVSISKDEDVLVLDWCFRSKYRSMGWSTRIRKQDTPGLGFILENAGRNIRRAIMEGN